MFQRTGYVFLVIDQDKLENGIEEAVIVIEEEATLSGAEDF